MRDCVGLMGFYVYMLVDPRDGVPFYIGKGKNKRYAAHIREWISGAVNNINKYWKINDICAAGLRPKALCLRDGLAEGEALDLEKEIISRIGINNLTNYSEGHQSEEVRGLKETELAIDEHFNLDLWPEVVCMSPIRKKMWCQIRDSLVDIADGYRRLIDQRRLI